MRYGDDAIRMMTESSEPEVRALARMWEACSPSLEAWVNDELGAGTRFAEITYAMLQFAANNLVALVRIGKDGPINEDKMVEALCKGFGHACRAASAAVEEAERTKMQ